jgi:hypothetical protein
VTYWQAVKRLGAHAVNEGSRREWLSMLVSGAVMYFGGPSYWFALICTTLVTVLLLVFGGAYMIVRLGRAK